MIKLYSNVIKNEKIGDLDFWFWTKDCVGYTEKDIPYYLLDENDIIRKEGETYLIIMNNVLDGNEMSGNLE